MSYQAFTELAEPRSSPSSPDNSSDDDRIQEEQSLSGCQEMTGQRDTHHNPTGAGGERNLSANILSSTSPPTTSSSSSSSEESPEMSHAELGPVDRLRQTESDSADASAEISSQSSSQSRRSSFTHIDLQYTILLPFRIKKYHFEGKSRKKWTKQEKKFVKNKAMILTDLTLLPDERKSKKTKLFTTIEIQKNRFPEYHHKAITCAKLFDSTVERPLSEVTKTETFDDGRNFISFEMDLVAQDMVERVVSKNLRLELTIEMILYPPIKYKSSVVENDYTMIDTSQE